MRASMLCALLLAAAGCGRVGYDAIAEPDLHGKDARPDTPPGPPDSFPEPDGALPDVGPADLPPDLATDPLAIDGPPDAGADQAPPVDVVVPVDVMAPADVPPACTQPFSPPVQVVIPGVDGDLYSPRLSPDGLTLFFGEQETNNKNAVDLYTATRPAIGAAFSAATPLTAANSGNEDNGAVLTADRLELYFFSTRAGGSGNRDIWVLRRTTATGAWAPARPVTELNSSAADYMPSLTADALTIVFASNRGGGSGAADDIWTSSRPSRAAAFAPPVRIAELSSLPTAATSPFIFADGLTLLFADERAGGLGARDIWMTTRPSRTAAFATPTNMGALFNSGAIEDDPSISLDGRELFFASNRTANNSRFYRSIRCP